MSKLYDRLGWVEYELIAALADEPYDSDDRALQTARTQALLAERDALRAELRKGEDPAWRRERAMELGMGLGVEAYNDAMGWGS